MSENKNEEKKKANPHLQDAETFDEPVQVTRTTIIDDKYVIDRLARKLVIEYRIGNIDEDGNLVDVEFETAVYRGEEYDSKTQELFSDDKLFFAKGRNIGKQKANVKMQKAKQRAQKPQKLKSK